MSKFGGMLVCLASGLPLAAAAAWAQGNAGPSALVAGPVRQVEWVSRPSSEGGRLSAGGLSASPAAVAAHPQVEWRTPGEARPSMDDDQTGSTNVPMDSWVYPALERLGSMGLIPSQSVSIRPWTRQECRRQIREAKEILYGLGSLDVDTDAGVQAQAERLLPDLEHELAEPGTGAPIVESVYTRAGTIVGPALTDGFHFGQTWWNDFGRPLGRGTSFLLGYSGRAVKGRLFFYDRQEIQTDPGAQAVTPARAALFNQLDDLPFEPYASTPAGAFTQPQPAVSAYVRQRPLELYAGVAFSGNSLSFGKQELFWGPTTMGPLSFSSNAEPTYNLRLVATRPHPFPFLPQLGSYRFDLVFGKLSGHQHPARPYFNGQKIDLVLGRNLEMSFTRWSILWGVGHPMTLHSLKANVISFNSTGSGTFGYGDRTDPGDRKSDFDFRLHVPGVSRYVTVYTDSYADDEPSPIDAPRRVVWHPGIYLARLPVAPRADLRFEAMSSRELVTDEGGTRFFINNQYRDGNTNKGFLLGNAAGRDARSLEGRVGYWVSARTRVEAGYRQTKGSSLFLPGGSTISDGFINGTYGITPDWMVQTFVQVERFLVPSLMPGRQQNGSARIQITWTPNRSFQVTR